MASKHVAGDHYKGHPREEQEEQTGPDVRGPVLSKGVREHGDTRKEQERDEPDGERARWVPKVVRIRCGSRLEPAPRDPTHDNGHYDGPECPLDCGHPP